MLGLELGQEFVLIDADGNRKNKDTYKITEDGLLYKSPPFISWSINSLGTIGSLLNGDVKAVPKPWNPKYGEQYWSYSLRNNQARCSLFEDYVEDYAIWKIGNCFRTEEEAETKGKEIMEQIQKEYEEA